MDAFGRDGTRITENLDFEAQPGYAEPAMSTGAPMT